MKYNNVKDFLIGLLFGAIFSALLMLLISYSFKDTYYYQPAEIVAYNDTNVYFAIPDGNTILTMETYGVEYPNTVPYLLTVDSMGTVSTHDDVVRVAWRCVE